jgi:acetyl-CoA carboxylase biotin carboxyl carrier protein
MDHQTIKALIELVNDSNIGEVKIEQGNFKLTIRHKDYHPKGAVHLAAPAPVVHTASEVTPVIPTPSAATQAPVEVAAPIGDGTPVEDTSKYVTLRSPMIGTFYRTPSPDKEPFVKVGDKVKKGDILCIIEAMKLFNEIESEFSGTIVKVLVDNATPVEYDQPLFLIDPS